MVQRLAYFTAGPQPTASEAADIANIRARNVAPYIISVENAQAQTSYGPGPTDEYKVPEGSAAGYNTRPYDILAGSPPAGFSAAAGNPQAYTVPAPGLPQALITAPATISMVHTGTLQLAAVTEDANGNLADKTTDASVTWSSSDPTKATVGAHTGLVTGVAAGTVNIVATITATDGSGKTATAHSAVTLT